ncbi:hypothetical protein UlMin_005301 [Ulmus minor]
MQRSSGMDLSETSTELKPEKIEDGKEGGSLFHCDLYDAEIVHKIAQSFLPGLATACVDNTSGDIFKNPGIVAAEMRKEMVEYVTLRSENFVAETVVLEGGLEAEDSDHPFDIISDFVDDFASSKRNLFSRVSGWLLSEKREDKIDDFVQEIEINGFWLIDKREEITRTLLKNVDFKNEFHCNMKLDSAEELADHEENCGFKSTTCPSEGCNAIFASRHREKHDSICPFKIISCEQKCSGMIMRRDMDRHCITVCPMRFVSCPFYALGCQSPIPHCMLEQHRSDDLRSHLLYILRGVHKEASDEDLKRRVEQLEKESSSSGLEKARDVRSLTKIVKNIETELGPLEVSSKNNKDDGETTEPAPLEATNENNKEGDETAALKSLEANNKNKETNETPS